MRENCQVIFAILRLILSSAEKGEDGLELGLCQFRDFKIVVLGAWWGKFVMILLYALKLLQKLLVLIISYPHQNIIDYAEFETGSNW